MGSNLIQARQLPSFGPPATPTPNIYITFQGIGFSSGSRRSFSVMVGDTPPTISGGYAKWQTLDRLLQRGLTIFQGYDPVQMTVNVRFGTFLAYAAWDTTDVAGQALEADIDSLDWMAGGRFHYGPSPIVYLWCYQSGQIGGAQTGLIPLKYQYPTPWIITGLEWGNSYRNENGYRIWQDAAITLEGYLNLGQTPTPDSTTTGGYFVTRPGRDTALLIAGSLAVNSPTVEQQTLARDILQVTKNNPCKGTGINLYRRSISWTIPDGTSVWIPNHQQN